MLRYLDIAENETKLLALTGLTQIEFEHLVPHFAHSFADALRAQTVEGYDRIGRAYTRYRNSPLPAIEDKLLFILVYLKQYPTQTVQGQLFGLSQSNANKWIHLLHPILTQALALGGYLPQRSAALEATSDEIRSEPERDEPSLFSTMALNGPLTGRVMCTNRAFTTAASSSATRSKTSS